VGRERARRRSPFFAAAAQHVKSIPLAPELARGAAALAGLTGWGLLLLLLGG
jgi:hypothetical protein